MNIKHELVKALFDKEVRSKAAQMFQIDFEYNGHTDRMPIDIYGISFRLYKPTEQYVNLEFFVSTSDGKYMQPVGFYEKNNSVWVISEFEDAYNTLLGNELINGKAIFPDKKTNALIAAFSAKTITNATEVLKEFKKYGWQSDFKQLGTHNFEVTPFMRYDRRFESNGLKCELLFSEDGNPQFYLDDQYGLKDAFAAYALDENDNLLLAPTVEYKNVYEKLKKFNLLTAFN